jgi:Na+/proline symporter
MNYMGLDAIIVYSFLLLTLGVGLWAGRNVKTIEDYALANRAYSTPTLILTFLATWVGGNMLFGYTQRIAEDGMIMAIVGFSQIVSIFFIIWAIVPRMNQFAGSLTVGDLMGQFYGKYGRLITGLATLGYTIGLVGTQIVALGYLYELLGLDSAVGLVLAAVVIILYSSIGGIRAITLTDIIQFLTLIVAIPLLATKVAEAAGGIQHVFQYIPAEKLIIWNHKKQAYYWMSFVLAILPVGLLSPPYIQRLLMARTQQQASTMYVAGALFLPFLLVMELLIGFSSTSLYPNLKSTQIIPHIISQLMPTGLKGLCIAGLLAVVMSTADSFLGAGGLVVSQDLVKPVFKRLNWSFNELTAVRLITLCMGIISIIVAFYVDSIAEMGFYAVTLLGPLTTVPLVAGIMGLRADVTTFLTSSIFTIASLVGAALCLSKSSHYLVFPIALCVNLITFLLTHSIRYSRWVKHIKN